MQQVMNLGQVFRRQRHIRDRRDRFPNDVSVRAAPHQRVEHRVQSTEPPPPQKKKKKKKKERKKNLEKLIGHSD